MPCPPNNEIMPQGRAGTHCAKACTVLVENSATGCDLGLYPQPRRNRASGGRAVATLKTWRLLTKLRCCPHRATAIIAAIRVIQTIEEQPHRGRKEALGPYAGTQPFG